MAKQKRRPANDRAFKVYKAQNRRVKNKIRKLTNYLKDNPNDKQAAKALVDIKASGMPPKSVSRGTGQTLEEKRMAKLSGRINHQVMHDLRFNTAQVETASKTPLWEKLASMGYVPLGRRVRSRGHRKLK